MWWFTWRYHNKHTHKWKIVSIKLRKYFSIINSSLAFYLCGVCIQKLNNASTISKSNRLNKSNIKKQTDTLQLFWTNYNERQVYDNCRDVYSNKIKRIKYTNKNSSNYRFELKDINYWINKTAMANSYVMIISK